MSSLFKKALIIVFLAIGFQLRGQECDRYVVILSMDGFRWDMAEGAHTPTLDSIRQSGTFAVTYPCFPANTFPNHYSMATGLHPDNHGIVNNTFYDKKLGRRFSISDRDAVSDAVFWKGEPIWNTAERQGLTANIFMWPGSEAPVNGRYATVWTTFDSSIPFLKRADWVVEALHRPVAEIPNLIMWYFEEPDAAGHLYGPDSPGVRETVEEIDRVLAYFMAGVRTSPVYDKVNFIFTSDHGMAEVSPERYVNLYPLLDDSRIEYAITGTPLYLEPEPDYIGEVLEILKEKDNMEAFHREDLLYRFGYGTDGNRIPSIIVLPSTGWIVDYSEADKPRTGGSHGFDWADKDMSMVFYATGPDFREGYEHYSFQNLDIYALLAELLGIEPAPGDWKTESIKEMLKGRE